MVLDELEETRRDIQEGVDELWDGSKELADGVKELKDATDDMIEEYFTFDLDNLTSFLKKSDNPLDYYSFPRPVTVLPPYVLVYALIMPPVTAAIVNYFCISKKLRRTALSLLRNEQRVSRIREVKLGNHFSFATRFQIRQMLRESHSALAVIIGMYICLLIVVLSLDCYVMCENYRLAAVNETTYEYMYNYKYPTKEVPEGGTPAYAEGLKKEAYGYNLEVTILGITENNSYFDVEVGKYKNEIVIASAVAEKFQVKKGDKMVFADEVNHRDYAFTVKDVVYMESAFYCFMDLDAIYPLCISNIAVGMDLHFTWQMYVGVYMGVLLCYLIITPLLMRRIHKRVPTEILKNRE